MQLDFQQFLMKLEKLTDLRPIPDKEFVEIYIKAYYLTENDMEQFIKNHRVRRQRWWMEACSVRSFATLHISSRCSVEDLATSSCEVADCNGNEPKEWHACRSTRVDGPYRQQVLVWFVLSYSRNMAFGSVKRTDINGSC